MLFLAPTVAPKIVSAYHSSSSSIYIEWSGITETGYGKLLGYQITYFQYDNEDEKPSGKFIVKKVSLATTKYNLTNLFYYWRYQIKIGGYTRSGVGTNATKTVRTDEHCKYKNTYVTSVREDDISTRLSRFLIINYTS